MAEYIQINDHVSLKIDKIKDYFMGDPDFDVLYLITVDNRAWVVTDQARIDDIRDILDARGV